MKDLSEIGNSSMNAAKQLLSGASMEDMKKTAMEALNFDSAEKGLLALFAKREQLEKQAQNAAQERRNQLQALKMKDSDETIKKTEDAEKKLGDQIKRQLEAQDKIKEQSAQKALAAAEKHFEDERKRQEKLREDVAKGPGAGIEAGSADAARFMAQQANAAIAESVKVDGKPTDEQLVEEAKRQSKLIEEANKKQDAMIAAMAKQTSAIEENGWEAV